MQYGMQYIHVWYMYCTLYILHMYHMYQMQQWVMPLHITQMYDMMYRQYITSHIACVVVYDIYTLTYSSVYTLVCLYRCTTTLYQYICSYVHIAKGNMYLLVHHYVQRSGHLDVQVLTYVVHSIAATITKRWSSGTARYGVSLQECGLLHQHVWLRA